MGREEENEIKSTHAQRKEREVGRGKREDIQTGYWWAMEGCTGMGR